MVASYNPDEEKLFVTLNSCLIQKNVDIQIVITDDGSENFNPISAIDYFEKKDFHNYVLSALSSNAGTVKNVANGLKYCKGKYTKTISPGDYLYGYDCLEKWVWQIENSGAIVSFGDCINYYYENGRIKPISVKANPQFTHRFYKDSWAYNYLIFDDLVTGACMLTKTEKLREYEELILDKVVYAEDNVYRLMAYKEEKASYIEKATVLYEQGTGISTNGNKMWNQRIHNDWEAADSIMLSWDKDSFLSRQFKMKYYCNHADNRIIRKIKSIVGRFVIKGYFTNYMKRKMHPRYTSAQIDYEYIDMIHLILSNDKGKETVCK